MASPFPGMDPYIEASHLWEDFHHDLIGEIKNYLAGRLPERYVVRAGERSYIALLGVDDDQVRRFFQPDVAVTASRSRSSARKDKRVAAVAEKSTAAPITMQALIKVEYRETYLEIRQIDPEYKLVTGIEVLSPSNKRPHSKGWRLYVRKRTAYLSGHANFVEIDLLRGGRRMPMVSDWPESPYYLLVCRKKLAPRCSVWSAHFTEPLPSIPIPLAPPDADISLNLQPLIETIYTRSRYARDIDYRQPLSPPLSSEEAAWLAKRLQKAM